MSNVRASTLTEVSEKLGQVCFSILQSLDSERWVTPQQLIYSTVVGWDTAYEAYLVARRLDNISFPFAALTRGSTQTTTKLHNRSFTVNAIPVNNAQSVKSAEIKPVNIEYNLAIYDQRLEDTEKIVDLIVTQGQDVQKLNFDSEILEQPTSISFNFLEPEYELMPGKNEKRKEKGFIYGLNIPIKLDCVLGTASDVNLIYEAVSSITTYNPIPENPENNYRTETETITEDS